MSEFFNKLDEPQLTLTEATLEVALRGVAEELESNQRRARNSLSRWQAPEEIYHLAGSGVANAQGELDRAAGAPIAVAVRNLIDARLSHFALGLNPNPNPNPESPGSADVPGISRGFSVNGPTPVGTGTNPCELDRILHPELPEPLGNSGCISLDPAITVTEPHSEGLHWRGPDSGAILGSKPSPRTITAEIEACISSIRSTGEVTLTVADRYWLETIHEFMRCRAAR